MNCMKYTYKSPLNGSVYCEGLVNADDYRVDFGPEGVCSLYNRDDSVMRFLTDHIEDLKEYVPDGLQGVVVSAVFGLAFIEDGEMYLLTEVCTRQELTPYQRSELEDWIRGQLSDGWGEGLEQKEVFQEDIRFDITKFDEDECEFEQDYEYQTAQYYLHPWQYGPGWSLTLSDMEQVEVDIPEDDRLAYLEKTVEELKRRIKELENTVSNML